MTWKEAQEKEAPYDTTFPRFIQQMDGDRDARTGQQQSSNK